MPDFQAPPSQTIEAQTVRIKASKAQQRAELIEIITPRDSGCILHVRIRCGGIWVDVDSCRDITDLVDLRSGPRRPDLQGHPIGVHAWVSV